MSGRKAAFFDIDNTIWTEQGFIPPSCVQAIRALRAAGNLAFLCSGRTKSFIQDQRLFDIGFDGMVAGCGTMAIYRGRELFCFTMPNTLVKQALDTVRGFGWRPILEGPDHLYFDEADFGDDDYGRLLKKQVGQVLLPIEGGEDTWVVQKISCASLPETTPACLQALSGQFSFLIHNPYVVEMVPIGHDKATGIRRVCEALGLDMADTYAFGDGANDVGMLKAAGTGIAMGNGSAEAKAAADYVTDSLLNDGILKACEHFGLLS